MLGWAKTKTARKTLWNWKWWVIALPLVIPLLVLTLGVHFALWSTGLAGRMIYRFDRGLHKFIDAGREFIYRDLE